MIPIQRQTTMLAIMPPVRNVLRNITMASAALLACSFGIDHHNLNTSFFCFVLQDAQKVAPRNIPDCPAEPVALEHRSDVQALNSDKAKGKNKTSCDLVMMLSPAVGNVGVEFAQARRGLYAVSTVWFGSSNSPSASTQQRQCRGQVSRVSLACTITVGEEVRQANVDSGCRQSAMRHHWIGHLADDDHKPFVGFSSQEQILGNAFDVSVQLNPHGAYVLHVKTIAAKTDAATVIRVFDDVESVGGFEPGIATAITFLDVLKELAERPIQAAHSGLCRRNAQASVVGVNSPLPRKPISAILVCDSSSVTLIRHLTQRQAFVVKAAMRLQNNAKFSFLVGIDEKPVLECQKHVIALLRSLLVYKIKDTAATLKALRGA